MDERLNSDVYFIKTRLNYTIAVQTQIADDWVWDELTLEQWAAKADELYGTPTSLMDLQGSINADVEMAAANLHEALRVLHDATVTGVGLTRVRFRKEVEFASVIAALSAAGQSRQTILDEAEDWALAWEDIAPDWEAGMSLAAFEALRLAAEAALRNLRKTQVQVRRIAGRLLVLALEIEDLLQAWYAAATAVFQADTVNGGLVRGIQTTYDRPKKRRGRPRKSEPAEAPAQ